MRNLIKQQNNLFRLTKFTKQKLQKILNETVCCSQEMHFSHQVTPYSSVVTRIVFLFLVAPTQKVVTNDFKK